MSRGGKRIQFGLVELIRRGQPSWIGEVSIDREGLILSTRAVRQIGGSSKKQAVESELL